MKTDLRAVLITAQVGGIEFLSRRYLVQQIRLILSINPESEAFPIRRREVFGYLKKILLIQSDRRRTPSLNPFCPLSSGN